jgi:hypothetical protein
MPFAAATALFNSVTVIAAVVRSTSKGARNNVPRLNQGLPVTASGRYGPGVELGIEQLDDMLDRQHGRGKPCGLFVIVQDLAADVGVKTDQVGHGRVIGCYFERVWHHYCSMNQSSLAA